ncbi:hypothetical protein [Allopontixanthobacter sediminis]|uniref:Uncharacterized protein n=1 Tax=Allopontixanthobacter sediminis TaxID=1689985 RepID=A0A845B392_9SPHN|nr:hypothetical protein [Allopontixanthobacter sediminis]MXP44614.1 hypothetical protein [Allopontixanthobacter sediminis]
MHPIFKDFPGLLKFIVRQRFKGFSPPGNEPYMPPAEVKFFKENIGLALNYVEFGSGGSTVYASRLGVKTISVENDRFYAQAVAAQLHGNTVTQIVASMGITREWGMPLFPSATKAKRYVTAPWGSAPFPQFILIDGRYRVACALESARQAHNAHAKSVLMFDDYSMRPQYHMIEEYLGSPIFVGRAAVFHIGTQVVPLAMVEKSLNDPA